MNKKLKKGLGLGALVLGLVMNLQYALVSYSDGPMQLGSPLAAQTAPGTGGTSGTSGTDDAKKYPKDDVELCYKDCSYVLDDGTYVHITATGSENLCTKVKTPSTCTPYNCNATCAW